jgi:hypothetical protein
MRRSTLRLVCPGGMTANLHLSERFAAMPRGRNGLVDTEEHTLPDSLERRCAVCGAELTEEELHASREASGPFLCSVHASEQVPLAREEEPAGDDPEPG